MADDAEITKIDETTREKLRQTVAKIERLEEELTAVRAAGIPCEIIPGVTSASAAA